MRKVILLTAFAVGCGTPGKTNDNSGTTNNGSSNNTATNNGSSNNTGTNNAQTNNGSTNSGTNNGGDVGDSCALATDCTGNLRCQSAEEQSWNFCGAPMEPRCEDTEVGDSCGNCFTACESAEECPGEQTCNGTYCIGERSCVEERLPPP